MRKIAIYGAGGLGREIGQLITQVNIQSPCWELIGYYDDNIEKGKTISGQEILGGINDLNAQNEELCLMVCIADCYVRTKIVQSIFNENICYPSLIHPSVIMDSQEVVLGEGSIITAGNILTSNISIGKHSIINLGCTIGHDVVVGDYCAIMPGVHLSGNINIGEGTLLGTGARILQNLTIGRNARVGAGAVVTKNVDESTTVVGVPAQIMTNK